jgi:HNH endonuclease
MYGQLNQEVVGTHTRQEFEELVAMWGWRCFYCGKPVHECVKRAPDQLTEDHLVPLSRGGVNFIWNIVPACLTCNELKGMLTAEEFKVARPGLVQNIAQRSTEGLSSKKQGPSGFARQAVDYLMPMRALPDKSADYYRDRRALLKKQTQEIRRLQLVDAGQLTLPMFGDEAPRKIMETEPETLTITRGMHVADQIQRKA